MNRIGGLLANKDNRRMILALLVLAAAIAGITLWRSDPRMINRRFNRLVTLMEKKTGEKPLAMLARTREISEFLAVDVEVRLGPPLPVVAGRKELVGVIQQFRAGISRLEIKIRDRSLTVAPDRLTAVMRITAEAEVEAQGDRGRDIRELEVEWAKESGAWLIRKVALVETIRRPPQ